MENKKIDKAFCDRVSSASLGGYDVKYNKNGKLAFPIDVYVCAECATGKKQK